MVKQKIEKCFLVVFFLLFGYTASSQVVPPTEDTQTEDLLQSVLESTDTEVDFTDMFDQLEIYKRRPLNINKVTLDELSFMVVLSGKQIQSLIYYRAKNGPFISIWELQAIPDWDINTIYAVLPYLTLKDSLFQKYKAKDFLTQGRHDIIMRSRSYIEPQAGYADSLKTLGKTRYMGDSFNQFIRYRYRLGSKVSFGITAEKDAGEEFFKGSNKNGFDFYSGHLMITNIGPIKKLIIGDFMMQCGQGLSMWNGFAIGKTPYIFSMKRLGTGLRQYTSVNEALFQRGAAITLGINKKLDFTVFASKNKIDARVDTVTGIIDSASFFQEEQLNTFYESGYHRTATEIRNKNTTTRQVFGGRLLYKDKTLRLGLNGSYTQLNVGVVKGNKTYDVYDFTGKSLASFSTDYEYSFKNMLLYGEIAANGLGKVAAVNGAIITLDSKLAVIVHNRYIPADYFSFFMNPVTESSGRNEKGTLLGFILTPHKTLSVTTYMDRFTFGKLKFGVDAPSSGYDLFSEARYNPNKTQQFYLRFRQRLKQENTSNPDAIVDYLDNTLRHNFRLNGSYRTSPNVRMQSRVEWSRYKKGEGTAENGYVMFQDINFKIPKKRIDLSFRYATFETKSNDTRIYAYETDVLYMFSIPAYYGRGTRFYSVIHFKPMKKVDVWLRYAQTTWYDRKVVSSGLDLINGNSRSDFRIQARIQL